MFMDIRPPNLNFQGAGPAHLGPTQAQKDGDQSLFIRLVQEEQCYRTNIQGGMPPNSPEALNEAQQIRGDASQLQSNLKAHGYSVQAKTAVDDFMLNGDISNEAEVQKVCDAIQKG